MLRRSPRSRRVLLSSAVLVLSLLGTGMGTASAATSDTVSVVGAGSLGPGSVLAVAASSVNRAGGSFYYREGSLVLQCARPITVTRPSAHAAKLTCESTPDSTLTGRYDINVTDAGRADSVSIAWDGLTVKSGTLTAGDIVVR